MNTSTSKYSSYSEVPFYRRQWFFWLMYFTLSPIAIGILLFGDIYYEKKGEVRSFGLANRIVAGLIAVAILFKIFHAINELPSEASAPVAASQIQSPSTPVSAPVATSWDLKKTNNPIDGETLEASYVETTAAFKLTTTVQCVLAAKKLTIHFQVNDPEGGNTINFVSAGDGVGGRMKLPDGRVLGADELIQLDGFNNFAVLINPDNKLVAETYAKALGASSGSAEIAYTNISDIAAKLLPLSVELKTNAGGAFFTIPSDNSNVNALITACAPVVKGTAPTEATEPPAPVSPAADPTTSVEQPDGQASPVQDATKPAEPGSETPANDSKPSG